MHVKPKSYKEGVIRKLCCIAEGRLLHNGGSYWISEPRSAWKIWEARVCMAEAHGVWEILPSFVKGSIEKGGQWTRKTVKVSKGLVRQATIFYQIFFTYI